MNKNFRVGSLNRVGRIITPIKHICLKALMMRIVMIIGVLLNIYKSAMIVSCFLGHPSSIWSASHSWYKLARLSNFFFKNPSGWLRARACDTVVFSSLRTPVTFCLVELYCIPITQKESTYIKHKKWSGQLRYCIFSFSCHYNTEKCFTIYLNISSVICPLLAQSGSSSYNLAPFNQG